MSQIVHRVLPEHLAARQSAKRREFGVQLVAGMIALVCLVAAGFTLGPVNQIRKDKQLIVDPASLGTLPPGISLLGKLGTFRALAIDWAFIRSERLKEEGKTYEAHQLHLMICRLAPRFAKVWVYAAWNMAYNISVMKYTPEERWLWVKNGISLLRDEGIKYNPKSVTLFRELGWIFWHKIGGFLDDQHLNYKKALAVEMERVLGAPPVAVTTEDYFDWFRKIVDAPRDLDRMLAEDTEVASLVARLRTLELPPNERLLDFVARNVRPEIQIRSLLKTQVQRNPLDERRMETISDQQNEAALDRLLAAIRSQVLREKYRMDVDWMMDLMENQYGPLDWRNGFSHALYWSSLGEKITEGKIDRDFADVVNNARFVFFSLQNLIQRGKIGLWPNFDDPFDSHVALTPDTRFIPFLKDTYMRLGKKHFGDHPKFREGTPGPNYMTGLVTNMHTWIELLYLEGGKRNIALAEEYYVYLREYNPHPDGSTQERYLKTLDQFVMGGILDRLLTYGAVNGIIRNFVNRAFKHFSVGEVSTAATFLKRARACYDYWMADMKTDVNDRRKMPKFKVIVRDQLIAYIESPANAPFFKVTLWNVLPLELKQDTYDRLLPYFTQLCDSQQNPWSTVRAFPEPPGMEAARQRIIEYRGKRRTDIEQGRGDKN